MQSAMTKLEIECLGKTGCRLNFRGVAGNTPPQRAYGPQDGARSGHSLALVSERRIWCRRRAVGAMMEPRRREDRRTNASIH